MDYHRIFIMMQENDRGYSKGGKLSGYLKIEQNHSKVKALVHIQNVGLPKSSQVLKAYALSGKHPDLEPLYLGVIHLKGNTGSLFYECSKKNLAENYADFSKLDTVVVICINTAEDSSEAAFPLVGYRNQDWNWKDSFIKTINKDRGKAEKVEELEELEKGEKVEKLEKAEEVEKAEEAEEVEKAEELEKLEKVEEVEKEEELEKVKSMEISFNNDIYNKLSKFKRIEQPFEKIKKNYQWWMIDDINFDVNEIYEGIGKGSLSRHYHSINNFILYNNPYALNAIYQYGYYLIGVCHNAQYEIESIVYAIPSRYGIEPHPLLGVQAYAKWIPKNGHKVMLGSMGYWVVKIDVKSADVAIMD